MKKKLTIVTRVTIMAVKFVISDANVRSHETISELNVTDAAFETVDMVEET